MKRRENFPHPRPFSPGRRESLGLAFPFRDKPRRRTQNVAFGAKPRRVDRGNRLINQRIAQALGLKQSMRGDESRFVALRVFSRALAEGLRCALSVENVVGDLERCADRLAVGPEGEAHAK